MLEEIAKIKELKVTRNEKRRMLIKLGISNLEASTIMKKWVKGEEKLYTRPVSFTFGVEIECYNVNSEDVQDAFSQRRLRCAYERYNHDDNITHYKFVNDSSIRGYMPIECVSPILKGAQGFSSIKRCCESLNAIDAQVNRSTGMHVHIGVRDMTDQQYINTFHNYKMLETLIDSFMPSSRHNSTYCMSIKNFNFSNIHTHSELERLMGYERYYKVNPMSWQRHKTIEFRQHSGTINYEKISNWVRFCGKLVDWSKDNVFESEIDNINDIPFLSKLEKKFFNSRKQLFA